MKDNVIPILPRQLELEKEKLSRGRRPLYISHRKQPISQPEDFGDRVLRIRESLSRINKLISELREMKDGKRSTHDRNNETKRDD